MERVLVGDRKIAYHRTGEGPPLVLLHGGWCDGRSWRPQLAGLADGFDVIAWDAPGCGGSDDLAGPASLADYAAAVVDLVTALGLDRVHLCGHSFGAGLALAVYRLAPGLVTSLVLAGAYAGWRGSLPAAEIDARLDAVRAAVSRPAELSGFFAGPVPAGIADLVGTMTAELRPAGQLAMATAFADADLTGMLPAVAVPTLLLYGGADTRAPAAVAAALHAGIPGARLVVLPGIGHDVTLEAPERFNDEIRRFLGSGDRGGVPWR